MSRWLISICQSASHARLVSTSIPSVSSPSVSVKFGTNIHGHPLIRPLISDRRPIKLVWRVRVGLKGPNSCLGVKVTYFGWFQTSGLVTKTVWLFVKRNISSTVFHVGNEIFRIFTRLILASRNSKDIYLQASVCVGKRKKKWRF